MNKDNEKAIRPQDKLDYLPGNDSIRPGMNIGTVGFVGRGRPKFNFDDTAKTCAVHPPTMSSAEAIRILKNIETDIYGRIAINKAIDALINPWVKTADRLPTQEDAWYEDEILTLYQDGETMTLGFDYWLYVKKHPEQYLYWMPVPLLPEVTP